MAGGGDEVLTGVGELIFSLIIGYLGALELVFVARKFYHWSCRHDSATEAESKDELKRLKERFDREAEEARAREQAAGTNVMQDGVAYSNGFRVDPTHLNSGPADKQAQLEAELQRQLLIEEETRKQLAEAEAKLEEERKRKAAEIEKETAESARKLIEAEKQREAEQRQREEHELQLREAEEQREREENERKLAAAEEQRREAERRREIAEAEAAENERRLFEAEEQREREENEKRIAAAEEQRREMERQREIAEAEAAENDRNLFEAETQRQRDQAESEQTRRDTEIVERLLAAERERKLSATESELEEEAAIADQARRLLESKSELENKQRIIDENARLFLEAEEEMVVLQQRMLDAALAADFEGETPVEEEACIKKVAAPHFEQPPEAEEPVVVHKVKTQFGQAKNLMFPEISDEGSSVEPNSSQQSSFSTQPSEELTTEAVRIHLDAERQDPDGEDTTPDMQYTEEYLRSLDGIKNRPLLREDGSGRRRAFKKRRSSGSSNSSRDSRTSREEEVKMFTSLEEEELRQGDREDYNPIKYTNEPTLRVKSHHRRHRRSPAKDMKPTTPEVAESLEQLDEEEKDPWGESVPKNYRDMEFWKREKAVSIDEEVIELSEDKTATNVPKTSSFEDATVEQNKEAANSLHQQHSKDLAETDAAEAAILPDTSDGDNKSNLHASTTSAQNSRQNSPGLRRSPRIEDMDQYEERWRKTESEVEKNISQPPSINIRQPDTGPWRDEYGLLMRGLSDFYDFQASTNPSRSRSTSRNPSPQPKNVANLMDVDNERTLEVYDDTENLVPGELNCEVVLELLEATMNGTNLEDTFQLQNVSDDAEKSNKATQPLVFQAEEETSAVVRLQVLNEERPRTRSRSRSKSPLPTPSNLEESINKRRERLIKKNDELFERLSSGGSISPISIEMLDEFDVRSRSNSPLPQPVIEINDFTTETQQEDEVETTTTEEFNLFVENLRAERNSHSRAHSRSRSRSPLPTAENIEQGLEARRQRRIQQNEELFERLIEHEYDMVRPKTPEPPLLPTISIDCSEEEAQQREESPEDTRESVGKLIEKLRLERSRSRSRSKSPLPTPRNLDQSLENCRQKLIAQNDSLFEQLQERAKSPEPPRIQESPSLPTISVDFSTDENEQREESPEDTRESVAQLIEKLRLERSRSRSRSKSPLPTPRNLEQSIESRRQKLIAQNDSLFDQLQERTKSPEAHRIQEPPSMPIISVDCSADGSEQRGESPEDTRESVAQLIEKLRLERSRSRSRSKSPLPTPSNLEQSIESRRQKLIAQNDSLFEVLQERAKSPEPPRLTVEYVYEFVESEDLESEDLEEIHRRSLSPSRSLSNSPTNETEEIDSALVAKQRKVDMEALHKLTTANEEMEIRLLSPTDSEQERAAASLDDRSISEVARDMKEELMVSGFKRSTYVDESLDLGSEFEQLRREAAEFQRSASPSPSIEMLDIEHARSEAATQRELQAAILDSLTTASSSQASDENRLGAKPKTSEYERSSSEEQKIAQRLEEERSYVDQLDDLRHRTAEFQRSRSQSRSPPIKEQIDTLKQIEAESVRRELQDQMIDQIAASGVNFQSFSRYLNADFLDNERRASDSALIQNDPHLELEPDEYHHFRRYSLAQEQPVEEYPIDDCAYVSQIEVRTATGKRTWLKEDFYSLELIESSESLDSELMLEPTAKIINAETDWTRSVLAPESSEEFDSTNAIYNFDIISNDNDGSTNDDSEDERQTVVEIEDEFDEGISDYNERGGPTDESHHDTSECEEAERNADRYANREANDWDEMEDVDDFLDYSLDDGAVGGATPYSDPDSFIEQIYNDAIKNRKQSGILRDYESIIQEQLPLTQSDNSESEKEKSSSDSERYALWAKTRALEHPENKPVDVSLGLLESERQNHEIRYLGDANVAARQSTRLRTRYGYNPQLQVATQEDEIEVDLNYKPKREYNWRKNFKLDDNEKPEGDPIESKEQNEQEQPVQSEEDHEESHMSLIDVRRCSLGGESITLFSRSPDRELLDVLPEEPSMESELTELSPIPVDNGVTSEAQPQPEPEPEQELEPLETSLPSEEQINEKVKKKKSKKKTRKSSKTEEELGDDNDSDTQLYNRRSSMASDLPDTPVNGEAPKRKSRSRRSSKTSLTNEEHPINGNGLFSPRSSITYSGEALEGIAELEGTETTAPKTKKTKKRKTKTKEEDPPVDNDKEIEAALVAALTEIAPISISAQLTPASTQDNLLSVISAGQSMAVTPASSLDSPTIASDITTTTTTTTTENSIVPARSVVDTFDILKDANFYPLF